MSDDAPDDDLPVHERIAELWEETTYSTFVDDMGNDERTAGLSDRLKDADLTVEHDIEEADHYATHPPEAREFSFSVAVRLELVDRTTCPYCGQPNDIPDPALLTLMDADVPCQACGHPLEVVR